MEYGELMERVARGFEIAGVVVIIIGGVLALVNAARRLSTSDAFFSNVRRGFGRPLILGLEILVAADIIETITVEPSLENAAALGVLVLVRVILSVSLDIEVDGMLPWKRAETEALLGVNEGAA